MGANGVRAGRAFVEVFLRDKVTADLRKMVTRMRSMSRVVAGIGGALLGTGATIAAGFLAPISAASDLQEIMSKFDTVFGENAAAVKTWGDEFASQVGRSKAQIAEFLAGSQDLFVPLGFDEDTATSLSKTITGLSVDLASFNNKLDTDTLRDLHAALTGSGEVMKKYGVIVSEAAVKQELFNQGIKAKDATEQQKVMARLQIIMRGTTAAQGDAIKTAGSWANQNKRIVGSIKDTAAAIGNVLIPILSPFQTKIGDVLSRSGDWISKNKVVVLGVAAVAAGLTIAGGALLGLAAATWAASIPLGILATVTSIAGTVIGGTIGIITSMTSALWIQRGANIAAGVAMRIYAAASTVAKGVMFGLAGALGVVRAATGAARIMFLATAGALGIVRTASAAVRAAMTLANIHQLAFAAGGRAVLAVDAAWRVIRGGIVAVRAAMTLANIQQLAFGAGASVLGAVRGVWAGIKGAVVGTSAAMTLLRGVSFTTTAALGFMTLVANGGAGAMTLLSGALAAVQAAALGPLAPIALIAGAVAGLGAILYVNRASIFDFLGNSIASLQPILAGVGAQWSAFAGGISEWFGSIIGEAKIAWEGISAAIAVNDLQSSWTIAWNTMKLVALQTLGPLQLAWNEFTTGLISMFDGAIGAVRKAFSSASTWIAQTLFAVLGTLQKTLDKIAEFDPTGVAAKLRGLLDVDTEGINQILGEDNDRYAAGLDADRQRRDEERGSELAASQAELAKEMEEAQAAIRKARDEAVADAKKKKAEQDAEFAVAPEANPEAFDVAALFEEARAGLKETQGDSTGKGIGGDVQGTFSGVAAAMFAASGGAGTAEERTASATEKAVEQGEKIVKNTEVMSQRIEEFGVIG
jgi:hypothetical protein